MERSGCSIDLMKGHPWTYRLWVRWERNDQPCMQAAPVFAADGVQLNAVSNDKKVYSDKHGRDSNHEAVVGRSR